MRRLNFYLLVTGIILLAFAVCGVCAMRGEPVVAPPDICTGNYFYQETCNGGWNVGWPNVVPPGFTYEGCAAHTRSVYGETGRRFNIVDQGTTGSGYPRPPASDPSAQAVWDKCFIQHDTSGGYSRCSGPGPGGVQNPILRPLSQVTDPAKKASWTTQFGCGAPTPTVTPVPVPTPNPYADYIEGLFGDGITAGCGATTFCPDRPMTRAEVSVWLWKAMHKGQIPPSCVGVFTDVPCKKVTP